MATYYWRGSSGSLNLPSGWQVADAFGVLTPANVAPGSGDTVVLDTAGFTLSADAAFAGEFLASLPGAVGAVDLNGHTLELLGIAQFGDAGSAITGPGTLATDAVGAVPTATDGGVAVQLSGGAAWSNAGLVLDAGVIGFGGATGDAATVVNLPGALWALAGDQVAQFAVAGAGAFAFVNAGTLAKTAGSGLSSLEVPVQNAGVIDAATGTLALLAGGSLGGIIGGDAGQVRLAGTFALAAGSLSTVAFDSGAQWGAAGDGAAVLSGPGTLASTGTVRLTDWSGPQLVLDGGAVWDNAGTVLVAADIVLGGSGGSGTLVNQAGGRLDLPGGSAIGGNGLVDNAGTLRQSGGTSRIAVAVNNAGTMAVTAGTLALDGGGVSTGVLAVSAPGASLAFGGSDPFVVSGGYDVSNTVLQGGTLDLSGVPATFRTSLQLQAGMLLLGARATAQNRVQQSGGVLAGDGTLLAYGGAQLAGGVETGHGSTLLYGNSRLGDGLALDGGRMLDNRGILAWDSGTVVLGSGNPAAVVHSGTLRNAGLLHIGTGTTLLGSGVVENAGVMAVAGTGEAVLEASLHNLGVLQVTSGTLSLDGGGRSSGSQMQVGAAAALRFGIPTSGTVAPFRVLGGRYAVGNTMVDGGWLDLSTAGGIGSLGSMAVTQGGQVLLGRWSATVGSLAMQGGGTVSGTGTLVVSGGAQLGDALQSGAGTTVLRGASSLGGVLRLDGGRTLQNQGVLAWNAGTIALGSGDPAAAGHAGTLANANTGTLQIVGDVTLAVPGAGRLVNDGMLSKAGGSGGTALQAAITNNGTVLVQVGTLACDQAVSGAGTFLIQGGELDFAGIVGGGETIRFAGAGTLGLAGTTAFGGVVAGLGAGDALDLAGLAVGAGLHVGFVAQDGGGTLTVGDGMHSVGVSLQGSYVASGFTMGDDGHGGVLLRYGFAET